MNSQVLLNKEIKVDYVTRDEFRCLHISLQTHHVDSTLKRRGNGRFHVVPTSNPRGVGVGFPLASLER